MAIRSGNNGSFAESEIKEAWLSGEFGESYARHIFGDALVNGLPRYQRGQRKGQIKGKIAWRKITKGGWVSGVGLVSPGKTYAHGIFDVPFGREPVLVAGHDAYDRDAAKASLVELSTPAQAETAPVSTNPVFDFIASKGHDALTIMVQQPDVYDQLILEYVESIRPKSE